MGEGRASHAEQRNARPQGDVPSGIFLLTGLSRWMHKYAYIMNKDATQQSEQRRQEILRIVQAVSVHSQDDLLELLAKRGVRITQPTLSRDIRALALAKTPAGYVAPGALAATLASVHPFASAAVKEERLGSAVRQYVTHLERSGSLIVLKTAPADANHVARALDEAALDGVIGTIAGDDTIFLAVRTSAAARLTRQLSSWLSAGAAPRRARA